MDFNKYKHIRFERDGCILHIILNKPDQLNRVDGEVHAELSDVFYDAAADHESDIIVLSGAGRMFTAGGDIGYMKSLREDEAKFRHTIREAKRVVFGLLDCDKPVICKVQGDCIGLGTTMAFLCDIIVAEESSRFCDPHCRVGLTCGDGGAIAWPQAIGYARAKYYMLTGEMLTADDALAMGLVNFVVPVTELDNKVNEIATKLANGARYAIRSTKATMNIGLKALANQMMDAGMAYEAIAARTEDHAEAVSAFIEKRRPNFTGR